MFARARITTANLKSAPTIPRESVFSTDGIFKVFKIEEGKAAEKSIGIAESTDKYAVISSGLSQGDTVIVLGRNLVEDGSPVVISNIDSETGNKQPDDSLTGSEG